MGSRSHLPSPAPLPAALQYPPVPGGGSGSRTDRLRGCVSPAGSSWGSVLLGVAGRRRRRKGRRGSNEQGPLESTRPGVHCMSRRYPEYPRPPGVENDSPSRPSLPTLVFTATPVRPLGTARCGRGRGRLDPRGARTKVPTELRERTVSGGCGQVSCRSKEGRVIETPGVRPSRTSDRGGEGGSVGCDLTTQELGLG